MSDDDFFDDEAAGFGDPVHPDDRLWRHPSELHKVPPVGSRSIPDTVDFAPIASKRSMWAAIAASSFVGATLAVSVIMVTGVGERVVERWNDPEPVFLSRPPTSSIPVSTSQPVDAPADLRLIAESAAPSMVWITVVHAEGSTDCAGVVIRADGHLITDSQPFAEFTSITVRLSDGTSEPGLLVGIDPLTELAVVHVGRNDLVPAAIGDPGQLGAGGRVLLLEPDETGGPAATAAMVNAVGTPARLDERITLYNMIEFDSPVPANLSGGPLLNEDGEVVGITARAGSATSGGFATPIDAASMIANDLITVGKARHPWLGIEGRQEQAQPLVVSVVEDSPADVAGLQPNDVIMAVDGEPVPSMAAFVTAIRGRRPGDEITISYQRDGDQWECTVVLGLR